MTKEMTYDEKSYDLAEHFLEDETVDDEAQLERMKDELAKLIQTTIEDQLAAWREGGRP
jgi:hypothetical protein